MAICKAILLLAAAFSTAIAAPSGWQSHEWQSSQRETVCAQQTALVSAATVSAY